MVQHPCSKFISSPTSPTHCGSHVPLSCAVQDSVPTVLQKILDGIAHTIIIGLYCIVQVTSRFIRGSKCRKINFGFCNAQRINQEM